jgi:hypothetical protein
MTDDDAATLIEQYGEEAYNAGACLVMSFIAQFGEVEGIERFKQHVGELKSALEQGGDLVRASESCTTK